GVIGQGRVQFRPAHTRRALELRDDITESSAAAGLDLPDVPILVPLEHGPGEMELQAGKRPPRQRRGRTAAAVDGGNELGLARACGPCAFRVAAGTDVSAAGRCPGEEGKHSANGGYRTEKAADRSSLPTEPPSTFALEAAGRKQPAMVEAF